MKGALLTGVDFHN